MDRKSDHKHIYKLVEIENAQWFTHEKVCEICEKVFTRLRIEDKNPPDVPAPGGDKRL